MSLVRLVTVNCDAETHARTCPGWIGQEWTAREARELARRAGWVHVGAGRDALDYAPACWALLTEATP